MNKLSSAGQEILNFTSWGCGLQPELPFYGTQGREAGISLCRSCLGKAFLQKLQLLWRLNLRQNSCEQPSPQSVMTIIKGFIKHGIALLDILSYGFKSCSQHPGFYLLFSQSGAVFCHLTDALWAVRSPVQNSAF